MSSSEAVGTIGVAITGRAGAGGGGASSHRRLSGYAGFKVPGQERALRCEKAEGLASVMAGAAAIASGRRKGRFMVYLEGSDERAQPAVARAGCTSGVQASGRGLAASDASGWTLLAIGEMAQRASVVGGQMR